MLSKSEYLFARSVATFMVSPVSQTGTSVSQRSSRVLGTVYTCNCPSVYCPCKLFTWLDGGQKKKEEKKKRDQLSLPLVF